MISLVVGLDEAVGCNTPQRYLHHSRQINVLQSVLMTETDFRQLCTMPNNDMWLGETCNDVNQALARSPVAAFAQPLVHGS